MLCPAHPAPSRSGREMYIGWPCQINHPTRLSLLLATSVRTCASELPQDPRPPSAEYPRSRDTSFGKKEREGCTHWLPRDWVPIPSPCAPAGLRRRSGALANTATRHRCSLARKADPKQSRAARTSSLVRCVPWRPEKMRNRDEPREGSG